MSKNEIDTAPQAVETTTSTVVFIHGFLDSSEVWNDVRAALPADLRHVAVDLAGAGDRVEDAGEISLSRFATDLVNVIDSIPGAVVLVGQSMGAQVAELAGAQRADRVKGLVLITPVPLAGPNLPEEVLAGFAGLGGNVAGQRAAREQLGAGLSTQQVDALVRIGMLLKPKNVEAQARAWNAGHAAGSDLSAFKGPVLVIAGAKDGFVSDDVLKMGVLPRFADVRSQSIDGAGHWPHVARPAVVAGLVTDFLKSLALGESGVSVAANVRAQGWTQAFAQKTQTSFADAFAPEITLQASVLIKPIRGVDSVKAVMSAASSIYESLKFTHEAVNGDRTYIEWEAYAFGGKQLLGVTVLEKTPEGKILNVAIHHRPLLGALEFSREMGRRLAGVIDSDHFHSGAPA